MMIQHLGEERQREAIQRLWIRMTAVYPEWVKKYQPGMEDAWLRALGAFTLHDVRIAIEYFEKHQNIPLPTLAEFARACLVRAPDQIAANARPVSDVARQHLDKARQIIKSGITRPLPYARGERIAP